MFALPAIVEFSVYVIAKTKKISRSPLFYHPSGLSYYFWEEAIVGVR